MAITRNVRYRQLVENSRQLRSGRLTVEYMNKASQSWCVRKSSPLSSPASEQSKNANPAGRPRQSNLQDRLSCDDTRGWVAPISALHEQGNVSNGTNIVGDDRHLGSGFNRCGSNPPASNPSDLSTATPHRSTIDTEEDSPSSTIQGQEVQVETVDVEEGSFLPRLDDVGLPSDGVWDHDAAYDHRFCFEHGETEYLLGTASRWMPPGDFDSPNAEAALDAMLQSHRESPSKFEPHSWCCQAECWGSLFSHIHSVLDKREDGDRVLFLVGWKACWTPESYVVDQDWIPASLEANKNRNCRRSTRLGSSFEDRKKKYEKMMVVVNLE